MALPGFDADGYLPPGVHQATEAEITFRFGTGSRKRRRLALRVRRWIELSRLIAAPRLLIDGSYVTAALEPKDVDAVLLLPATYDKLIDDGDLAAIELDSMIRTRRPEELFAADTLAAWDRWVRFFSKTRTPSRREKGLVEVML